MKKARDASAAQERRFGTSSLAQMVRRITSKSLGREGLALSGLYADWAEILGQDYAALCLPGDLVFHKRGERRAGTLSLHIYSADAPKVQLLGEIIMARINGYFGFQAVARLRLIQDRMPSTVSERSKLAASRSTPAVALTAQQLRELEAQLETLEDDELREALARLGQAVMRQGKTHG